MWTPEYVCAQPWNAYYRFQCEGDTTWSAEKGPVSHHNYGGPKLRISYGLNPCGGTKKTKVQRKFGSDGEWLDITQQGKNFNDDGPFDGYGRYFYDKTPCSSNAQTANETEPEMSNCRMRADWSLVCDDSTGKNWVFVYDIPSKCFKSNGKCRYKLNSDGNIVWVGSE